MISAIIHLPHWWFSVLLVCVSTPGLLVPFRNNTAYIQNWLQVLKADKRFIVSASSKAEKAVNYILTGQ